MSPKNSIASAFFLPTQILKNINMPRHLPTAQANSEGVQDLILHRIYVLTVLIEEMLIAITMHNGEQHKQFITFRDEDHLFSSRSFFPRILCKNTLKL